MNIGIQSTVGWIIRDENGVYKGPAQGTDKGVRNPLESELQGILMALPHCWELGFILENDCSKAIGILKGKTLHFSFYNWIREIRWWVMRFDVVHFQCTSKEANKCVYKLARSRLPQNGVFVFHNCTNDFIKSSI